MALDAAAVYAIEALGLTVRNALAGVDADRVLLSGLDPRGRGEPAEPLAHGLPPRLPDLVRGLTRFRGPGRLVVARYGDGDAAALRLAPRRRAAARAAALVEMPLGKGRVVLFGFRPQYRGQSRVTYPALLNALFLSAAQR